MFVNMTRFTLPTSSEMKTIHDLWKSDQDETPKNMKHHLSSTLFDIQIYTTAKIGLKHWIKQFLKQNIIFFTCHARVIELWRTAVIVVVCHPDELLSDKVWHYSLKLLICQVSNWEHTCIENANIFISLLIPIIGVTILFKMSGRDNSNECWHGHTIGFSWGIRRW